MGKLHRIKRQFNKLSQDKKDVIIRDYELNGLGYATRLFWSFRGQRYNSYQQYTKKVVRDYLAQ